MKLLKAKPVTFASRLCLLISLAVMASLLGMEAVAHGQGDSNAFPPYTSNTPAKQFDVRGNEPVPLTVELRRTKTSYKWSNAKLGALAYAGGRSHDVQIGVFAVSGTTDTQLLFDSRDAAGNNRQTYLVYTFMDRASQCRASIWPTGVVTDGRIHNNRPWFTQTVRTAQNPVSEETIPLQGGYLTLSNHTAEQATGKHLCVGLKFHRENHSEGNYEFLTFSYYMEDTDPTLAGEMNGNTLTLTTTDESEIFQYRYIKESCDTAEPDDAGWKSLAWIDAGNGATSKRLVSNKQVEIVFPNGVNTVYCFDAQDMQKNVGRLTFHVDTRTPGVTPNRRSVSVSVGSSATYTVVLDSPPTAPVTVTPMWGTATPATVSPASRTFTPSNWNTAQPFTVTGVDAGTSAITHAVTSADTKYSIPATGTVTATVTIVDSDEPPEGPEPWNIRVVPGDGTLTVTWNVSSRDGVEDSDIWHVLRWSQESGVWANPRDPRAVSKSDGLSVDPGLTSYTITGLKNGVATGVFIRSMVGHRNNMSEREGNSSEWVRTKGEHTTPRSDIGGL